MLVSFERRHKDVRAVVSPSRPCRLFVWGLSAYPPFFPLSDRHSVAATMCTTKPDVINTPPGGILEETTKKHARQARCASPSALRFSSVCIQNVPVLGAAKDSRWVLWIPYYSNAPSRPIRQFSRGWGLESSTTPNEWSDSDGDIDGSKQ